MNVALRPPLPLIAALALACPAPGETRLAGRELAPVPDPAGLAGALIGTSNGAFLVAGGTNFPEPVWDTAKTWHDRIWLLPARDTPWIDAGRLTHPLGYAMTASHRNPATGRDRLICVGGEDGQRLYADVFALEVEPDTNRVTRFDLPPLPTPLANGGAAILDDVLYVVGGQTGPDVATAIGHGFAFDLTRESSQWQLLPPVPGGVRVFTHVVTQRDGIRPLLYVFGGRRAGSDAAGLAFLRDTWAFDPQDRTWSAKTAAPVELTAGQAVAVGDNAVLFLGYANGDILREVERRGIAMRDFEHPGFPRTILRYDTRLDTWSTAGEMPASHVTTAAIPWMGDIAIPSGEVSPRVRSPRVWHVTITDELPESSETPAP